MGEIDLDYRPGQRFLVKILNERRKALYTKRFSLRADADRLVDRYNRLWGLHAELIDTKHYRETPNKEDHK